MTPLGLLSGDARRRCMRLLRRIRARGVVWARRSSEFRDAERLHRAGLITAVVSKYNLFGGPRPYRELGLYPTEAAARRLYRTVLPR